jgi:SprT protein
MNNNEGMDNNPTEEIQQKLQECAEMLHPYEFPLPSVVLDLRGHTAGYAIYAQNKIRLNVDLLQTNYDRIMHQTLPHEFAHIAAYNLYGREGAGHGRYWQQTMRRLGLEPERCHNMETTPARETQKFKYICNCAHGYCMLGTTRHKRTQRNQARYRCGHCGTTLTTMLPYERW